MPYQALYRKYRPQTFDAVLGQDSINQIFKNQIKYNRVGHAYILSGIRGTGKTSLAKIFARAINCENPDDGNPCNACNSCLKIDKPGVMDIIEIDGASNRGVDEIREIREKVKYPPLVGKYKVYIIDEVHMLTKEAFNALLKTLEEPPAHVVFILATTEVQKCPATILSRCQRYEVKPISNALIVSQLRRIATDFHLEINDKSLEFIALKGENSMRDSLSLMDQIIDLKDDQGEIKYSQILSFMGMVSLDVIRLIIDGILEKNPSAVILQLRELQNSGKESQFILDQIIDYLRNILLVKSLSQSNHRLVDISSENLIAYEEVAKKASFSIFYEMIDYFIDQKNKLKYNNLQNIILEMACLKLAYQDDSDLKTPAKIKKQIDNEMKKELPVSNEEIKEIPIKIPIKKIDCEDEQEVKEKPYKEDQKKTIKKLENIEMTKSDSQENNNDELYDKLCNTIGSAQCIFLKKGIVTFKENTLFIDYKEADKDSYDFINRPEHINNFEKILKDYGKSIKVAVRIQKEDFNDLDIIEKTRRIINDDKIKIVND